MARRPRRAPRSRRPRNGRNRSIAKSVAQLRANVPYVTKRVPADPPFRNLNFMRIYTHRIDVVNIPGSVNTGYNYPINFWDPVTYIFAEPEPTKQDLGLSITPTILGGIATAYYAKANIDVALISVKMWGPMREDIPIRLHMLPNPDDIDCQSFGADVGTNTRRAKIGLSAPKYYWVSATGPQKSNVLVEARFDTSNLAEAHKSAPLMLGYIDVTIGTRNPAGTAKTQFFHRKHSDGVRRDAPSA